MLRRLIATGLVVVAPLAAEWSGLLTPIEDRLSSARMEMQRREPTGTVVVVDIDAKSIAAIGNWPWPRRVHAELIDKLVALGASEIAMDVDFSAPSNPTDDAALEAALQRAGGSVVLAAFAQNLTGGADVTLVFNRPLPRFSDNAWVASVNVRPDRDGQVRNFSYGLIVDGAAVPSMPVILGGGLGEAGQAFPIDFSINARAIDRISMIDVLRGVIDPARVAGKKIIVGSQAVELRDFFSVPVAGTVSGALLQAAAAETLLQGRVLAKTSLTVALAGIAIIALATLLIGWIRWSRLVGAVAIAALGIEGGAVLIQANWALDVDTAPWHLALAIFAVVVLVREIDIGRLLQMMWRVRASNAETLLLKVVADNFAGVVVVDESGRVRAASRRASELLGASRNLAGAMAREVLPPELMAGLDTVMSVPGFDRIAQRPKVVTLMRGDGQKREVEFVTTISEVENDRAEQTGGPKVHHVACLTFTDVTEQRAADARIAYMARFDSLTELPNRNQIIERLEEAFTSRDGNVRASAIVTFDLDGFKRVNDTLGHQTGDLLLRAVAARAKALLPPGALVARLGGDEFAAIFAGRTVAEDSVEFARRVVAAVGTPFQLGGRQVIIGASAGVAHADARDKGPDDVFKRADVALYSAKSNGGNGHAVFERRMLRTIVERERFETELEEGLGRGEFEVWYQPQMDVRTDRMTGVEALLRWRHPERGMVSPAEFIPVAEAIGFIDELGEWVLRTACAEVAAWPAPVKLAVNVSSAQFARNDIAALVGDALAQSGLPAARLDVEITESLFMQPSTSVHSALAEIRAMGVGIALDDFGTGYSSLSYIQKFPISKLKLDRSFVAGLPGNASSASIVRAVAGLAKELDLRLNAEGVETPAQAKFLASIGVDEIQGYLYGQAQPADSIVRHMQPADTRLSA